MKPKRIKKPTYQIIGPIKRFNQKNTADAREDWDSNLMGLKELGPQREFKLAQEGITNEKTGYTYEDYALRFAAWFGLRISAPPGGKIGFYSEEAFTPPAEIVPHIHENMKKLMKPREIIGKINPNVMSEKIKSAANFFGADLVGICKLNRLWIYSHSHNLLTGQENVIEIPQECKYAIIIASEMDRRFMDDSVIKASAATGLAYFKCAFVAGSIAEYIRNLGYQAIPSGNDIALPIPIAIDAGLGELGRSGILITPEFGSRVRLSKVFTDLPLKPDKPVDFGVQSFCEKCGICANSCPSQAICRGGKTAKARNISNNPGVLKWPLDAEKCRRYWVETGKECNICIKVCPYARKKSEYKNQ